MNKDIVEKAVHRHGHQHAKSSQRNRAGQRIRGAPVQVHHDGKCRDQQDKKGRQTHDAGLARHVDVVVVGVSQGVLPDGRDLVGRVDHGVVANAHAEPGVFLEHVQPGQYVRQSLCHRPRQGRWILHVHVVQAQRRGDRVDQRRGHKTEHRADRQGEQGEHTYGHEGTRAAQMNGDDHHGGGKRRQKRGA